MIRCLRDVARLKKWQLPLHRLRKSKYEQTLLAHGIPKENIRKYGFAFQGAEVLIGEADAAGDGEK